MFSYKKISFIRLTFSQIQVNMFRLISWRLLLLVLFLQGIQVWCSVENMNTPVSPIMPGSTLTINWINNPALGSNPDSASLEMVSRTTGQIWPISKIRPDDGSYNWDLPKDIPEGDYYIRMMGLSAPLFTGNFHVNNASGIQTKPESVASKSTNQQSLPSSSSPSSSPSSSGSKSAPRIVQTQQIESEEDTTPNIQKNKGKQTMTSGISSAGVNFWVLISSSMIYLMYSP